MVDTKNKLLESVCHAFADIAASLVLVEGLKNLNLSARGDILRHDLTVHGDHLAAALDLSAEDASFLIHVVTEVDHKFGSHAHIHKVCTNILEAQTKATSTPKTQHLSNFFKPSEETSSPIELLLLNKKLDNTPEKLREILGLTDAANFVSKGKTPIWLSEIFYHFLARLKHSGVVNEMIDTDGAVRGGMSSRLGFKGSDKDLLKPMASEFKAWLAQQPDQVFVAGWGTITGVGPECDSITLQ